MANARDIKGLDSNILIVGDSGTHKTFFAAQAPKAYVFDFDKGLTVVRGKDIEYDTFKEAPKAKPVPEAVTKATGLYPFAFGWPAAMKKLQELGDQLAKGVLPFKHVVFDSLTFMSDIAMNHVLMVGKDDFPHQGSYGNQQRYLMRVFDEVTTWPVRIICTAHIQRDKNDITGVTEKLPLLTGKLAGKISGYFDEVWYTDTEGSGDSKKYFILTEPAPDMRQVKSRLGIPNRTPLTWEALLPYLEGRPPAKAPVVAAATK